MTNIPPSTMEGGYLYFCSFYRPGSGLLRLSPDTHDLVLVTKPYNKTPYELLLGRIPIIGFIRPFGCPVTILNTLDPLGKFDRKANERFLVGYTVSSKAFRVFNCRTRIVQETLHINFLENQPNVAGSGPTWLFDIDTLTQSMNYQLVVAEKQPNSSAGIQEHFNAVKEHESEVHVSPSSSDKTKKHDDKTTREAKEKSHVELSTGVRNLSEEFEDFSYNKANGASGPSNNAVSLNFELGGKYSYVDPSQYPDDPEMPALEYITYSDDEEDVGAEADFSNLETNITASPILTTRVHKDHHVTQIIGDLSSAPQTKSMTRMVKEQGGMTQIIDEDFHTWTFACFLSQEEPKRGHTHEEGIDYEEVFAPVARIEAIRRSVCLSTTGFKDPDYPDKVYKVVKALYGLHQASRA
nr:hypothetical protein [Tanacetum cinerariifolium]